MTLNGLVLRFWLASRVITTATTASTAPRTTTSCMLSRASPARFALIDAYTVYPTYPPTTTMTKTQLQKGLRLP